MQAWVFVHKVFFFSVGAVKSFGIVFISIPVSALLFAKSSSSFFFAQRFGPYSDTDVSFKMVLLVVLLIFPLQSQLFFCYMMLAVQGREHYISLIISFLLITISISFFYFLIVNNLKKPKKNCQQSARKPITQNISFLP